jgi:hypothetical protein
MSSNYDETTDIELLSHFPTASTRGHEQPRSDCEDDVHSAGPSASSSKCTTVLPQTSTKLEDAFEHLSREFVTQDAKLTRFEASTGDGRPHRFEHRLRKEVRRWLKESLKGTRRTGSRPIFSPISLPISRFLMARAGSKNPVTREDVGLIWAEAESMARETGDSIAIKTIPGGERKEEDKAEIKAVIASWGASV